MTVQTLSFPIYQRTVAISFAVCTIVKENGVLRCYHNHCIWALFPSYKIDSLIESECGRVDIGRWAVTAPSPLTMMHSFSFVAGHIHRISTICWEEIRKCCSRQVSNRSSRRLGLSNTKKRIRVTSYLIEDIFGLVGIFRVRGVTSLQ